MTQDIAEIMYLIFSYRLMIKAIEGNLKPDFIQGQLNEAKNQLNTAVSKSQGGLHHGF
jgi:hypothetical protein